MRGRKDDSERGREAEAIETPSKRTSSEPVVQRTPAREAGGAPPAYLPATGRDPLAFHAPAAAPAQPVVQRKVSEGWHDPKGKNDEDSWNAGVTEVDSHGKAGRGGAAVPNAQAAPEQVGADAVSRLPLEGLTKCPSHRAIVVVPAKAKLRGVTNVDVLLHFHGAGSPQGPSDGIEQSGKGSGDKKPAVDAERTHDLHLAKIPQQIAAYGGAIVAITVEQTNGDKTDFQDGLVAEVFEHLRVQGFLTAKQTRGRTIVSGYSAGYAGAIAEAAEHEPGKDKGTGDLNETVRGLILFDPYDGSKTGHAKLQQLITRRLDDDKAQLTSKVVATDPPAKVAAAQSAYLETDGYMVRVFAQEKFNTNTKALNQHIADWFTANATGFPADAAVRARWQSNYQAIATPGGSWDQHGVMEGDAQVEKTFSRDYDGTKHKGHLQQGLEDWSAQHAPHAAKP